MKKIIYVIGFALLASAGIAGAQTDSIKSVMQQQVKTVNPGSDAYGSVQEVGTAAEYKAIESGVMKIMPPPVSIGSQGGAQTIKGVLNNAQTNPMYQEKDLPGANPMYESQRLLPPVNKRESAAPSVSERQTPKRDFGDRMKAGMVVEVKGWDPKIKETQIRDFEKNTEGVIEADENIADAEVTPDHVKVLYTRPAKLFGFIPISYRHAFTVNGKGKISDGKPWWLFFAANDATDFASSTMHIYQHNQTNLEFIKMPDQIQTQSQIFNALTNILKTRHDTAASIIQNMK